ncbi:tyrosine-type recombinase/integrase [Cronbergia sp. UHCC 0137]|uniref:tyrosine-type recombinase/integrase n=1 Tax=Cronbergia sp. UHCC 0137 TaxID=3110239 RepID=UPI002B203A57|nr:tyrosine-type recombinase/integrase [Cronbergia sp. UHCC 0137]MEA5619523.1 tyrosine-type recombinase/integrase [Cronbergia sp. UHCC 0137]
MAVTVDPKSKKILIRFRVNGYAKQFYLSTGLKDTKKNRVIVESRWELIQREISLGEFDSSLERYKFGDKNSTTQKSELPINELWTKFTEFQEPQLEQTTIRGTYRKVERYIRRFPTHKLSKASEIRNWLLLNTSAYMSWDILHHLDRCCRWAVGSKLIPHNPFESLLIPKPKRKSTDTDGFRAFSLEQRDIIIEAFENHSSYSHYAPLIKFLFWTGCRLGEAFALTWGDVSEDCCQIAIAKSRNLHGIAKGTKNGKKRIFTVSSDSRLSKLLLEIRPHPVVAGQIIFLTKQGNRITSYTINDFWKGYTVKRGDKKYFYPGIVTELVNAGEIPYYLKPYATRHTFATWAIASGVTPDRVALWIGDNVETVLKYYVHPSVTESNCPDF